MKLKYVSGDIIRKQRLVELPLFYATLRADLLYNASKYHSNISNGCGVLLRKQIVDPRPPANMDQGT